MSLWTVLLAFLLGCVLKKEDVMDIARLVIGPMLLLAKAYGDMIQALHSFTASYLNAFLAVIVMGLRYSIRVLFAAMASRVSLIVVLAKSLVSAQAQQIDPNMFLPMTAPSSSASTTLAGSGTSCTMTIATATFVVESYCRSYWTEEDALSVTILIFVFFASLIFLCVVAIVRARSAFTVVKRRVAPKYLYYFKRLPEARRELSDEAQADHHRQYEPEHDHHSKHSLVGEQDVRRQHEHNDDHDSNDSYEYQAPLNVGLGA